MARAPRSHTSRIALRSLQMVWASGLALLAFGGRLLCGDGPTRAAGRAIAVLCARLGATFIKVGQIASTRADLLPGPVIEELQTLQDELPAFPFAAVRAQIERELGRPLEDVYATFEPEPVAAASVAQVHRATLHGGEVVAVKVRRPDIADRVALDRSILLFVSRGLERVVPTLRLVCLEEAMREFCRGVEAQLDLAIEARNNERFQANFANEPDVVFPRLHPDACASGVLTMEFIEGVHERDLEASGVDIERVVAAGIGAVCRMIFLHGFVHADLHPGNLRFLPPGRLVLLDLGLVGELLDEDRLTTAQLIFALATGDGATVARLFYENAPHTATPDYAAYEAEISQFVEGIRKQGLGNVQLTVEIGRIFDILRRHRVQARAHMTMVNLALMTAEGLGKRLAPEMTMTDEALPYLAEALGVPMPGVEEAG